MTSLCGRSFHLEHPIGGGQGLVVSGEGEVAEARLQVDDQVGGAVEREGGVTRKKREPAMQWTDPEIGAFRASLYRQVRHQTLRGADKKIGQTWEFGPTGLTAIPKSWDTKKN